MLSDQDIERRVARALADRRAEVGITQAELATRLGVSQPKVSRWEVGRDPIPLGVLVRWCELLGWGAARALAVAAGDDQYAQVLGGLREMRVTRPGTWRVIMAMLVESPVKTLS